MNPNIIALLWEQNIFFWLKEEHNQEKWISFARYILAMTLCRLHKDFRYMIYNKTLKTDQPQINFYSEDIITYIKKHHLILNIQRNSKAIYQEIIKNEYDTYNRTIYLGPVYTTKSMECNMEKYILLIHMTIYYTQY